MDNCGAALESAHSLYATAMVKSSRPSCDPFTGVEIRVGVMGSAAIEQDPHIVALCNKLGRAVAESGCTLLTGACAGLPHIAAVAANAAGGRVIGISPASSLREHVDTFHSPFKGYDTLIFTGLGCMGRELINIRSSDMIVVVGGRCGTLGEFAIAYEEGKLIGVLTGSGGITDALPTLEPSLNKQTGAEVLYGAEPTALIAQLLERYGSKDYHCPCHPDAKTPCACADAA